MSVATPTRLAVFTPAPAIRSPSESAVLERVRELIAASAPPIAAAILDRALARGTIGGGERAGLLGELLGAPVVLEGDSRPEIERLRRHIRAAIARAAPGLARPLLADAVARERLTPAQEARILGRLRAGALLPLSLIL